MNSQDLSIDQVTVSIIANVIRDKFAGIIDFKPLAQYSDLFIFESQISQQLIDNFKQMNDQQVEADINERQFELVKRRLTVEIEAITGFVVSTLEFVNGARRSQFLILVLKPMVTAKLKT